jgi:Fur family transcriptional regulator, ferric uptake regulator
MVTDASKNPSGRESAGPFGTLSGEPARQGGLTGRSVSEERSSDELKSVDDVGERPQERSTRQKRALAAVLEGSDTFRSAQELFAELRASGENVGLTTVYNQLRALAENGEVDVLRSDDGESLYRRCTTGDHHHHLVCRRCGRTVEVEGPEVEQWAERVAAENRFVGVSHTLEVFGTCAACVGPSDPRRRPPPS